MFTSQWQASCPWGWAGLCFNASRPTLQPPTWQPRFEVHHDASRHVFSCTSLWKEPQCALDSFPSTWSRGRAELVNHIGAVFLLWHTTCMHVDRQCQGFLATRANFIWGHSRTTFVTCAHLPHNICSVPTKVGGLETKTDDQQFSKSTGLQKRDPNPTHQGTCWTHHRHHQWSCHLDHNFWGTLYRFGWEHRYLFSNVLPIGGLLQVWYCWATWDKGNCLLQYL